MATTPRSPLHRVPLGRSDDGMRWLTDYLPVLVIGPPRSGKTSGFVVPTVASWDGPALVSSGRDDVYRVTATSRRRRGKVWLFDPAGLWPDAPDRVRLGLLDQCSTYEGAHGLVSRLIGQAGRGGLEQDNFWFDLAKPALVAHLFAAGANGYALADVMRWIKDREDFEVRALLQATGDEDAIASAESLWATEDRARSSIYSTMISILSVFDRPSAIDAVDAPRGQGFDADAFVASEGDTIYLCAPPFDQQVFSPLFSMVMDAVLKAGYDRNARTAQPAGLLCMVDEAGNVARINNLDRLASTAAGCGIQLVTVWHSRGQIQQYGPHQAETIVASHPVIVALPTWDPPTLHWLSERMGLDPTMGSGGALVPARPFHGLSRAQLLSRVGTEQAEVLDLVQSWTSPDLRACLE